MARRLPILSAFDPGMYRTGWCTGSGVAPPQASAWRLPDEACESLGRRMDWLERNLQNHVDAYRPDAIAYERPLLTHHDKLVTLRHTYSIGAVIEFVAVRRGIEVVDFDVFQVKAALAGSKGARKDDMVDAALRLGVALPGRYVDGRLDAADAVGVWMCLLRQRCPVIASKYDAMLNSERAGLLI
jgi:Holliday junction resolvasome RuvABC endonuclease subunit